MTLQLLMHCIQAVDEDTELVSVWTLVYMDAMNERSVKRTAPQFLCSEYMSTVLAYPGRFQRRYRMSFAAFSHY